MKIGLTGTISCGKTTLVKALAELPEFKDYFISTERSKYLRDLGIPLNTDSTILGQYMFLAERSHELMHDNLITDRTIWDVSAFTLSAKSINDWDKRSFVEAAMCLNKHYDLIVYVSPEGVEIENNGVRETNAEYRTKIDFTITEILKEYKPQRLITVSGSTEERIKLILEELSK